MSFLIHTMDSSTTLTDMSKASTTPFFSYANSGAPCQRGTQTIFFLFFCPVQSIVSVSRRLLHFIIYTSPPPQSLRSPFSLISQVLSKTVYYRISCSFRSLFKTEIIILFILKPLALASLKQLFFFSPSLF